MGPLLDCNVSFRKVCALQISPAQQKPLLWGSIVLQLSCLVWEPQVPMGPYSLKRWLI